MTVHGSIEIAYSCVVKEISVRPLFYFFLLAKYQYNDIMYAMQFYVRQHFYSY